MKFFTSSNNLLDNGHQTCSIGVTLRANSACNGGCVRKSLYRSPGSLDALSGNADRNRG
jgi:hypothetical protein